MRKLFDAGRATLGADNLIAVEGESFIGPKDGGLIVAGRARDLSGLPDRCIRYIFSDASVGRDMHTIQPGAWQTDNFARNPVFLWAHQSDEPPIGRVEDLRTEAGRLVGQVRYAERDAYPFADTIYELTKRGFLNATSTGWIPLEWSAANDRSRPGGLDFRKVELLEISQVPVPALPTALVTARSAGVDTKPLFDWAERMLDMDGFASVPRAELESLRKAARMPSRRSQRAKPNEGAAAAGEAAPPAEGSFTRLAHTALQRDLMNVAELCWHMDNLEGCWQRCAREAEVEGDGSAIPGRMRAWLDGGLRILADIAGEETQEQIDGKQAPDLYEADGYRAIESAVARALKTLGVTRIGNAMSAENRAHIRKAHGHATAAVESLSTLLDDGDDDNANPDGSTGDDIDNDDLDSRSQRTGVEHDALSSRKLRERKARALAKKIEAQAPTS